MRMMYHPHSTALMPWATTVAAAAPPTPSCSGPIKAMSSPMLSTVLNSKSTAASGCCQWPAAGRLPYYKPSSAGCPAESVRQARAPSIDASGTCSSTNSGQRTPTKTTVSTAAVAPASASIQAVARRTPFSSPAPNRRLTVSARPLFMPKAKFIISPYRAAVARFPPGQCPPGYAWPKRYPPDYRTAAAGCLKTAVPKIQQQPYRVARVISVTRLCAVAIMRTSPYTKRAKSKTSLLYHAATAHTREKSARFRQISRQNVFYPLLFPNLTIQGNCNRLRAIVQKRHKPGRNFV